MSIADKVSGYRRHLSYDETLAQMGHQAADAAKKPGPAIIRDATKFVNSNFFERLREAATEDMQARQNAVGAAAQAAANVQAAAARTGVPPTVIRAMGPPGRRRPPGSSGGAGGRGPPGPLGPRTVGNTPGIVEVRECHPQGAVKPVDRSSTPGPSPFKRGDDPNTPPDGPPPPMGGAGAVRADGLGTNGLGTNGLTANQIAEVNQLRMQAELHRLEQEARHAEKRASMAETAANQLYQQRMATPMHVVQHLSQNVPPPPPPPPPAVHVSVTGGLTPDAVAAAMQQAMTADRRSVQELVERQGHSLKAAMQAAVAEHHTAAQQIHRPTTHEPPKPDAPLQGVNKKIGVKVRPKQVPPKQAPPKGEPKDEAQVETPAEPSKAAPSAMKKITKDAPRVKAKPKASQSNTAPEPTPEPSKAAAPPQPTPAKKREPVREPDEKRSAPPQRKVETRKAARELLDMYYKRNSGGGDAQTLLEAAKKSTEFILKTGHARPDQRMNAQDSKRSYDEVLTQIESFAKGRAGVSIADMEVIGAPRRRAAY